ncbi:hypothetical protein Pint_30246 [Pistacia integerrima]|uniref:Uncharacterized protein n=1 Tax=Pistacia integerrima TaxID=434235 RepID=A0ACC0WXU4_9ROSI|nr:hypothetical protein Pint_30246 [Pistacia integerrima]
MALRSTPQRPQRLESLSTFAFPHSQLMDEQERWVNIVIKNIEESLHKPANQPDVTIFLVPKTLMHNSPTSYTPQHVSLGPNHCWRPELHDMEGYKISAAKNFQQHLPKGRSFKYVVDNFVKKDESEIRARYQRYIYFKDETLAWLMAVDSAFLLEFLQVIWLKKATKQLEQDKIKKSTPVQWEITIEEGDDRQQLLGDRQIISFLVTGIKNVQKYTESTAARGAILRDIVMLENQIPLIILEEMLHALYSLNAGALASNEEAPATATRALYELLYAFLQKVCPFEFFTDSEQPDVSRRKHYHHLLHYMYVTILPDISHRKPAGDDDNTKDDGVRDKQKPESRSPVELKKKTGQLLSWSKSALSILKLPKRASLIVKPVTLLLQLGSDSLSKTESSWEDDSKPPEIDIPSATELERAGVRFSPIKKGERFTDIKFDSKKAIFKLPPITLDDNTEVVLRNLVAYEASNPSASVYFTRYTELMNGIIDTAGDVKLLKERSIIRNKMKSEEEAANMWNTMSRSLKKKKVKDLDAEIKSVNEYYNGKWKIKAQKFMNNYVYEYWQLLTFVAAVLFLFLEMFEGFCSVYDCTTILHFKK